MFIRVLPKVVKAYFQIKFTTSNGNLLPSRPVTAQLIRRVNEKSFCGLYATATYKINLIKKEEQSEFCN